MSQTAFLKQHSSRRLPLVCGVLTACLVGGGIAVAQTKQLKEPAEPVAAPKVVEDNENADVAELAADAPLANGSYSVVVESKIGPDGKTIQTKKVWRDGKLVESEEKTLDGDAADATIQLPNGETAPGRVFHFDFNDDVFGDLGADASPFEAMRRIESQMREQQEQMRAQMEELRRRFGESSANGSLAAPQDGEVAPAPSKFWIGATVEPTPELLVAQLPINEGEGILLQYIVPDSPAAKAGLQRFDVVVKIDGAPIANALDVAKIVDKTAGKTVKVEFFRKGKPTETKLTPAERPQDARAVPFGFPNGSSRFQIVRPGLIVSTPDAEPAEEAPKAEQNDEAKPAEEAPKAEQNDEAKPAEEASKAEQNDEAKPAEEVLKAE